AEAAGPGKGRRHETGLISRAAHRGDGAGLVHRRADDREVKPLAAADIAVEYFADMQAEVHVGNRFAGSLPALVQLGDAAARGDRRGQGRAAGVRAVFRGEDGERAVADELEHVTALSVNRRDDGVGVVVQQRDDL